LAPFAGRAKRHSGHPHQPADQAPAQKRSAAVNPGP
jgi:hypothetical protein